MIRPMSNLKAITMQESSDLSRACANALLDAYCRSDVPKMSEIAAEVDRMGAFCTANFAETERLELVGGIALELHRSASLGKAQHHVDPYIKLLLHLAHPEWTDSCFAHHD
jgi:hypothetical protein